MPSPAPGPVCAPAATGSTPVFVDDTGRRHRFVRGFGWTLAAVVTVYLALLAVSLVGSPGLVPLSLPAVGRVLPGPAAPNFVDGPRTGHAVPGEVPTAATAATRAPASPATVVVPSAAQVGARQQARTRSGTGSSAAPAPATSPSASPSPARSSQGKGTPSATSHPSNGSTAHPTPHSTRAGGTAASVGSPSPIATATP